MSGVLSSPKLYPDFSGSLREGVRDGVGQSGQDGPAFGRRLAATSVRARAAQEDGFARTNAHLKSQSEAAKAQGVEANGAKDDGANGAAASKAGTELDRLKARYGRISGDAAVRHVAQSADQAHINSVYLGWGWHGDAVFGSVQDGFSSSR